MRPVIQTRLMADINLYRRLHGLAFVILAGIAEWGVGTVTGGINVDYLDHWLRPDNPSGRGGNNLLLVHRDVSIPSSGCGFPRSHGNGISLLREEQ